MNRDTQRSVYDQTYHRYLEQLKNIPFKDEAKALGITLAGDEAVIPYFGEPVRLTPAGLVDESGKRPDFSDCVVICRYLIMACEAKARDKTWVAFRDFPDAGPLTVFWRDAVERPIAEAFAGRIDALSSACDALGARPPDTDIACDLCRQFSLLPKVPLLLIFNDKDEDFPAAASLLFEKRADGFLDAESQAILGNRLTIRLTAGMNGE